MFDFAHACLLIDRAVPRTLSTGDTTKVSHVCESAPYDQVRSELMQDAQCR